MRPAGTRTPPAGAVGARSVRWGAVNYLFGLKGSQPTLFQEAKLWLGSRLAPQADATTEDFVRGQRVVRTLYVGDAIAAPQGWDHLRCVLRVHSQTFAEDGSAKSSEDRYFVSSLPRSRLTSDQWLLVIRRHWGVESAHQILDVAFSEDAHPFIEHNPRGALVVAILRRIAYTILTLFRSVTQRSDQRRQVPWKDLMSDLFVAFLTTTEEHIRDLRLRLSS